MSSNSSLVLSFLSTARNLSEDSSFQRQCIDRLRKIPNASSIGFVDGFGTATSNAIDNNNSNSIWGINYTTCNTFCNYKEMPLPFSYSTFSSAMTNYLLPWLALTAQLPYETGSHPANIMALFMALGSPALITYSLSLTVIHSYKLKTQFNHLRALRSIDHQYDEHLKTIQEVLQTAQHVPLRASQYNGWLSSLLVLKDNDRWWSKVRQFLIGRVRDFSPSALAQIGVAVVAWLLTIVAALSTKLGDTDTGLQIASGSLWIWLVPVVFGYIRVGVPNSARAIPEAFAQSGACNAAVQQDDADANHLAQPRPSAEDTDRHSTFLNDQGLQPPLSRHTASPTAPASSSDAAVSSMGDDIADSAVDIPLHRHNTLLDDDFMRGIRTSAHVFQDDGIPVKPDDMPHAFGMAVLGDAGTPGAAYTYARSLEFPLFVELIRNALQYSIRRDALRRQDALTAEGTFERCGDQWQVNMKINPFPRWSQVTADSWKRMFIAALLALFVQWGTTMASFMLAFLTPVQGLGCRSGSYVVYGVASTVAWILLVAAQLCSNEAMRIFQESQWTTQSTGLRRQSTVQMEDNTQPTTQVIEASYKVLKAAAVLCRLFGKGLCILNTTWLLLTSVAEIIGGFDNCWCMANRPSTGTNSWIVLFKTSEDLASGANSSWGGGFAITIFVSILAIAVFAIGSPRHHVE